MRVMGLMFKTKQFKNDFSNDWQVQYSNNQFINAFLKRLGGSIFKRNLERQVFFAGHIPQVTITGHSIFARNQHKNSLNSANRTRLALNYIFSKNKFRLGVQF